MNQRALTAPDSQTNFAKPRAPAAALMHRLYSWAVFEIAMAWRITANDHLASTIPFFCLATSTWFVSRHPIIDLPIVLIEVGIYGLLFIYSFCVVNQLGSEVEDRINKPWRPLATGLVSRQWIIKRAIASNLLFVTVGVWLHVPWPTLAWTALIALENFMGFHRHWFTRNVLWISAGTAVMLISTFQIVVPTTTPPWSWIAVTSVAAGIGCNAQDMRDIRGDLLINRKTLPIAWGETRARICVAIALFSIPLAQYLMTDWQTRIEILIPVLALSTGCIWVSAIRLLTLRGARKDHWSYQIFCCWYCATLLLHPLAFSGRLG
jgi:4-hydroxybenzoate polyprenyltransferase